MRKLYYLFLLFCERNPKFVLIFSVISGLLLLYLEYKYAFLSTLAIKICFWAYCIVRFFVGLIQLIWQLGLPIPVPILEFFDNIFQLLGLPSLEGSWDRFKNFLGTC